MIKVGAKVVWHARYVTFQMAEVLVSKRLFEEILERIHQLKSAALGMVNAKIAEKLGFQMGTLVEVSQRNDNQRPNSCFCYYCG